MDCNPIEMLPDPRLRITLWFHAGPRDSEVTLRHLDDVLSSMRSDYPPKEQSSKYDPRSLERMASLTGEDSIRPYGVFCWAN